MQNTIKKLLRNYQSIKTVTCPKLSNTTDKLI